MNGRQIGAQRGAITFIERQQFGRRRIRQCFSEPLNDPRTDLGVSKALALNRQIGQLLERVDGAKLGVEFKAVDDRQRLAKPDVLGPEIAVSIYDLPLLEPLQQQTAQAIQKLGLYAIEFEDACDGQAKIGMKKGEPVRPYNLPPFRKISSRRNKHRMGMPIKLRQSVREPQKLRRMRPSVGYRRVQHQAFIKALQDHQPVNDMFPASQPQLAIGFAQGDNFQIQMRRHAAVEHEFLSAHPFAFLERGKIEKGQFDRLLQFVGPVAREKDVGHMRFHMTHFCRRLGIAIRAKQKPHLVFQRTICA